MLEAFLAAIKFDEFLIALAGQMATEASARFTISTAKAVGVAMLAAVIGAVGDPPVTHRAPKSAKRKSNVRRRGRRRPVKHKL
jgi:hypothetical protein